MPRRARAKEHCLRRKAPRKSRLAFPRSLAFERVRDLWRRWKEHVPYDEAHYLAALAKRRSPLPHAA